MQSLLLATHNKNKIKEIKSMLSDFNISIYTLDDFSDDDEVEETGSTFLENAYLKAQYFAKKHRITTLSDDSGLVVEALLGQPGVFSQRYSGKGDHDNNLKLLKEMTNEQNRNAYFIAVIVLCDPDGTYKSFEGRVHGQIHSKIEGEQGFGYDAIFYYPPYNKTFGMLDMKIKNLISHRANALKKFKEDLYETINHK